MHILFSLYIVLILTVLLSLALCCTCRSTSVCGHKNNWSFFMSTRIFFYNLYSDKAALNVYVLGTVLALS